jgi:hypothetical protein
MTPDAAQSLRISAYSVQGHSRYYLNPARLPRQKSARTLGLHAVSIGIVHFHNAFGDAQWLEPELFVQRVSISSSQQHATQALEVRMPHYLFHETQGQALAAMLGQDVNVSEIGERCFVCYDSRKAYGLILKEQAKTQGIRNRAFDDRAWNAGRPVRLR